MAIGNQHKPKCREFLEKYAPAWNFHKHRKCYIVKGRRMNIKQFRRHLETLPDDALVVFESENPDTSLAFPAMAVNFTVKPILLSDGKCQSSRL